MVDTKDDIPYQDVRDIVEKITAGVAFEDLLSTNETAKKIVNECTEVKTEGLERTYYRARTFANAEECPESSKMGSPNSEHVTRPGRYNPQGVPVLYLSRTPEVAKIEKQPDTDDLVCIQMFEINSNEISILELDRDMEDDYPHLHHFLILSEMLPDEVGVQEAYRPTHFLKKICEDEGISGVEYPSLRAGYSSTDVNLVIFGEFVELVEDMMEENPEPFGTI